MRLDVILAVLMLIAVFLPWVAVGPESVSGFDLIKATFEAESEAGLGSALDAEGGWLVYVLYAIPVFALLTLIVGLGRGPSNIFAIIAGAAPWVLILYPVVQGTAAFGDMFQGMGIGGYATLLIGVLLVLNGLGILRTRS
jgi:hypothetical protein